MKIIKNQIKRNDGRVAKNKNQVIRSRMRLPIKGLNPNGFNKCQFSFRNQLCFTLIQNHIFGSGQL